MRIFLLTIFLLSSIYAKRDFFYGFINSSGNQISQKRTQEIEDGFEIIRHARQLAKDGRIDEAYSEVTALQKQNKIEILKSNILLLLGELSLKKGSKRLILEAADALEKAINASKIHEDDLPKAYMTLVELKLNTNKSKEAIYFANILTNNFDSPVIKAYGQIYLAKVYKHQKEYAKSIKILYEVLTKTTDLHVATIVADELFDVYLLDNKRDKAYELINKVLSRNMSYYADDSYLAIEKVNKLIKADMPEFAVEILKELLSSTKKPGAIEDFKYKLANTYLLMYDKTDKYLKKAKELYKDVINDFPNGIHFKKAKMYLDEILMREGYFEPSLLAAKYPNSEAMQQKVLLQELLNNKAKKKYDLILKSKRIYKKVSNSIAKRYGYESMDALFDEVTIEMIKQYLKQGKCFLLNKALKASRSETLETLIKDEKVKYDFFECLIEVPYEKAFVQLKETFNNDRDPNIYLYLERMAFALKDYNEAKNFSAKVAMVDDKKVLSKEFLYRFLILTEKNNTVELDKFFDYATKHEDFIKDNSNNPIIMDFYYGFYLYLRKKDLNSQADDILEKLYNKQMEMKAYVYSPFVELELSKVEVSKNNNEKALNLLLNSLEYSRRIRPNGLAQVYYEIEKLYESFGNKLKQQEYINKCKDVKGTKDSFYKKMCDEM